MYFVINVNIAPSSVVSFSVPIDFTLQIQHNKTQRNLRVIYVITGEIKSKIDQIWNAFWSGGISNPLEVMEQMTYLLFIRRLDEIQITK